MAGLFNRFGLAALCVISGAMIALAGEPKPASAPPEPKSGFRAELLGQINFAEKRIEDLASAMPAEKYSWRPGEGVRSVSEVYVHIIGANYLFMSFLGVKPPMKMDPDMEKTMTDKSEIAAKFKPSFDHFRNAVLGLSDKDLDKTTKMFGSTTTYRNVLVTAIAHLHEHLGQSIAYARVNGIVPPWTAAEQAEAAKKGMK
ncbi:MAG TPA: DinB family protein [Bacteroidota bacterium]|nr:DinB family protein [Bacteroidota bacterium]